MTLQAYQNTQRITEDSRATEYRLFGQITGALIDIQKNGQSGASLVEAVDWNKKLWRTLAADCMDERNQLPRGLARQDRLAVAVDRALFAPGDARRRLARAAHPGQPHHHVGAAGRGLGGPCRAAFSAHGKPALTK